MRTTINSLSHTASYRRIISLMVKDYIGSGDKVFWQRSKEGVSYTVASLSVTILAVCSCTVLPLFAGIYKKGAGIGPVVAFLYAGPAINILAIILTARVLGWELGVARAIGAILFAVIIGLIMAMLYKDEDESRTKSSMMQINQEEEARSPAQNLAYFATLVLILIFAAWGKPAQDVGFLWRYLELSGILQRSCLYCSQ